jgi:hypothetical protein
VEKEWQKLLREAADDPDNCAALKLSYGEFLRSVGHLKEARAELKSALNHADSKGYAILALHTRTVLAELSRLLGHRYDWQRLAGQYRNMGCDIGELYATTIGRLGGAEIAKGDTQRLVEYALTNGLTAAAAILAGSDQTGKAQGLRLAFPGTPTTY